MNDPHADRPARSYTFGPFSLLPEQQLLLEGDQPIEIGGRALAILTLLVQRAGEIVSKDELIAYVWPGTYVEDSNLRVHIAGLRRALNDGRHDRRYIVNISGRGYCFSEAVTPQQSTAPAPAAAQPGPTAPARANNWPPLPARIIGRSTIVNALCSDQDQHRLITLIGPGGIGKTTVAVAVAQRLAPSYRDGIYFVDFGPINSPTLVPSTLSGTLGLAVPLQDAASAIINYLARRQLLLVLDNCEHVIDAAAAMVEGICAKAEGVHILATSREPLRVAGERVHRLGPLESPPDSAGLTAAEAMTFPSVQLLVEHADAALGGFELSDLDAPVAADICRRLDGIALAIELAARRVAAFGMQELRAHLDDRFRLLTSGRRTALSRHQTLTATLDWSFDLLTDQERRLLRRLAVFAGEFTLDAATAIAEEDDPSEVLGALAELVSKSLVVANIDNTPRYRLLETTRLYALNKLRDSGELQAARRIHATYFTHLFADACAASTRLSQAEWIATYGNQLDNARAALDWAGSTDGGREIFVALTIGVVPLWVQLSLMNECRDKVEQSLGMVAGDTTAAMRSRMQLHAAKAWSLMYTTGRSQDIDAAWTLSQELAEHLEDTDYRMRALWGHWIYRTNRGDFVESLRISRELTRLADGSTDSLDAILAERLLGVTLHYRGEQDEARRCLERMLNRYVAMGNEPRVARFQVDPRATARTFLSRILWLQGFADQATEVAKANVEEGQTVGHALSLSNVLGQSACVIALLTGDLEAAREYADMLLDHEKKYGLRLWLPWVACFDGLLAVRAGDVDHGLQQMRAALDEAGDAQFHPRYTIVLGEYAACLGLGGHAAQGLEVIEALLSRGTARQERWYIPEALRIKGELLLMASAADASQEAEACWQQAISVARQQGARSWELRTAISLAKINKVDRGRNKTMPSPLSTILESFREGYNTADLRQARCLLAANADAPSPVQARAHARR
jgi:predicted ATPase/DNA-binding winged helix-turn-helix (wHTH) protein